MNLVIWKKGTLLPKGVLTMKFIPILPLLLFLFPSFIFLKLWLKLGHNGKYQ